MTNHTAAIERGYRINRTEDHVVPDLVQRACKGDANAFGQLYELMVDRVYRYVYFRVTNEEAAEDLTSKVFLKAWEHLPNYKPGSSPFIAWLYTIARNTVIDHYRVQKPTTALDEMFAAPEPGPLPDEQYERQVQVDCLRQALQRLTNDQREVVTMKLIDGVSTDDIARHLHKSPGAVRALQMRGLQSLAKILRKEEG